MNLNIPLSLSSISKIFLCAPAVAQTGAATDRGTLELLRRNDGICPANPVYAEIDPSTQCMRHCAVNYLFDDAQSCIPDTGQNVFLEATSKKGKQESVKPNNVKKAEPFIVEEKISGIELIATCAIALVLPFYLWAACYLPTQTPNWSAHH